MNRSILNTLSVALPLGELFLIIVFRSICICHGYWWIDLPVSVRSLMHRLISSVRASSTLSGIDARVMHRARSVTTSMLRAVFGRCRQHACTWDRSRAINVSGGDIFVDHRRERPAATSWGSSAVAVWHDRPAATRPAAAQREEPERQAVGQMKRFFFYAIR
jgi:hypothetical protein